MTDCNRKTFVTNKPARSKFQSKSSDTVVWNCSTSSFHQVHWNADDNAQLVFICFVLQFPSKQWVHISIYITQQPYHMCLSTHGWITTWSIIIRQPVFVTLLCSINLAFQRWRLLPEALLPTVRPSKVHDRKHYTRMKSGFEIATWHM